MGNGSRRCFTIGHSIHPMPLFIDLLERHGVDVVVDVRSVPFSRMASHFNRGQIEFFLKEAGKKYIYLGDRLGARHETPDMLFEDGRVDFERVAESASFEEGIQRVMKGIEKGYTIALMCSEKEPFDCHRFVLVSRALSRHGVDVTHILPESTVSQNALEERLFEKYKLPRHNLLMDEEAMLAEVYRLRNRDIAYNAFTKEGDEI